MHFVSSPVSGGTGSLLYDAALGGYNIYTLNNTAWIRIFGSDALIPGKSYTVDYTGNKTISFAGMLNSGTITITDNGNKNEYCLVGNPYPCPISVQSFFSNDINKTNTKRALYLWSATVSDNSADYATCNFLGCTAGNSRILPNGNISSGQGFLIDRSVASPVTCQFTDQMKVNGNNNQFLIYDRGAVQRNYFSMADTAGIYHQILIALFDDATTGFDSSYDAYKLKEAKHTSLYSLLSGDTNGFAIQGIPAISDSSSVKLGFESATASQIIFTYEGSENLDPSIFIYLKDKTLNKTINLKTNNTYAFQASKGISDNRFELQFRNTPLSVSDFPENNPSIQVYGSGREFYVKISPTDISDCIYSIYDLCGRAVISAIKPECSDHKIKVPEQNGMYILSVKTKFANYCTKILVQ